MGNDINSRIQAIMALKSQGKNPQQLMQTILQQNPNYKLALQRMNNMAQGRDLKEFIIQLARQNGATQESINAISQLFGNGN